MRFPTVEGANLERRRFRLPGDFEGEFNLVLIAFKREQQFQVDTWVPLAKTLGQEYPDLSYYELPTISRSVPLARFWLDSAMRAGIPDQAARAATITLYLDKGSFRRSLELPDEEAIYALLVARDGRVLWRARGRATNEQAQSLQGLLQELHRVRGLQEAQDRL